MTTPHCTFHPDQNRISHRVLSPGRRSKWLSIMGHASCYVALGKKLWIEIMILPCQTSCVVVVRREDHFVLHYVFWCQEGGDLTLAFSSVCRCFQIVEEQHRFSLMWHDHSRVMWLIPYEHLVWLMWLSCSPGDSSQIWPFHNAVIQYLWQSYIWMYKKHKHKKLHVIPLWTYKCSMQVPNAFLPGAFWHFALQLLKSHPVASSVLQKDF